MSGPLTNMTTPTNSDIPTPRTDAKMFHCGPTPDEGFEAVPADFARQLERELAAANAARQTIADDCQSVRLAYHDQRSRRSQLQEALQREREHGDRLAKVAKAYLEVSCYDDNACGPFNFSDFRKELDATLTAHAAMRGGRITQ